MQKTDIIEIKIPNDIIKEIHSSDNLSTTLKLQLAKSVESGKLKVQNSKPKNNYEEQLGIVIEILKDRSKNDKYVTLDEICEMAQVEKDKISSFMMRLNKFAKNNNITLNKQKINGQTSYSVS